jgi:hypothetical protein
LGSRSWGKEVPIFFLLIGKEIAMKKLLAFFTVISVVFVVNTAQTTQDNEEDWSSSAPPKMDLQVGYVKLSACNSSDSFKKSGPQTLSGPGAGPGPSNHARDAFTAPSWDTFSPPTMELYSFPTTVSYIEHVVVINNYQGPWPTPVTLAYIWQECGNGVMFPPVPATLGTNAPWDGATLGMTLPYADGCWYISVGISGFSTGTWDWAWLARYDGVTPIPVLPQGSPGNDTGGGNYYTFQIYSIDELRAGIGGGNDGIGADRPWCFRVY